MPIAYINKQNSACDSSGIADLRLVEFTCGPKGVLIVNIALVQQNIVA